MLQEIETEGKIHVDPIMFPKHRGNVSDSVMGMPHDDREIAVGDLAFLVVAAFRRQPHINNVLTHISGANWQRVEQAQRAILDPLTAGRDLGARQAGGSLATTAARGGVADAHAARAVLPRVARAGGADAGAAVGVDRRSPPVVGSLAMLMTF